MLQCCCALYDRLTPMQPALCHCRCCTAPVIHRVMSFSTMPRASSRLSAMYYLTVQLAAQIFLREIIPTSSMLLPKNYCRWVMQLNSFQDMGLCPHSDMNASATLIYVSQSGNTPRKKGVAFTTPFYFYHSAIYQFHPDIFLPRHRQPDP